MNTRLAEMDRLLNGVRVLDLSHVWFGPYCTKLLADMGAEVIKIEPPWGEMIRLQIPQVNGANPEFVYLNNNKKGMTLNLKSEKGVKIFKELVKISDVVVENFAPGTMKKLGIDYDVLKGIKSNIIYASLSGYGQYGPYFDRPSFDIIAQAVSGYLRLTGDLLNPNGPPVQVAQAVGDLWPGTYAALSIVAALYYRNLTGKGQMIDVSQVDCMIASCGPAFTGYTMLGLKPHEISARYHWGIYGLFKAKDGYLVIGAPLGHILDALKSVIGKDDISMEIVQIWIEERFVKEVIDTLVQARVPCAPVYDLKDTLSDPQIKARDGFVKIEHPQADLVVMPNFPVKFSETPVSYVRCAPLLGEHDEEILTKVLGYTKEEVKKLKEDGVL
jgi:crotonobetainyl-CoA:carnitine CoA-transferase CaiB-like acyl-CoA transferase